MKYCLTLIIGIAVGFYTDRAIYPGYSDWNAYVDRERTICDLKDGERAMTYKWAFTGEYPIVPSLSGEKNTWVYRQGDQIVFWGERKPRVSKSWMDGGWECKP